MSLSNIAIEKAKKTPKVICDADKGQILLEGRSVPENSIEFYHHVFGWIEDYFKSPKDITEVELRLEYFNTSSANVLLRLLKTLDGYSQQGYNIVIYWCYEFDDEEFLEEINSYQKVLKHIKIQPKEIEEF